MKTFNGKEEPRDAPRKFEPEEILEKVNNLDDYIPGKNPKNKKRKHEKDQDQPTWHLKASLFDLPYWSKLKLTHNLDVMHIEKNILDNILETLLELEGKNKDTISARLDLKKFNIGRKYWLQKQNKDDNS